MRYKRYHEPEPEEEKVIAIKVNYALDRGIWLDICQETGLSEWAVNEGSMSGDDWIYLTKEQAKKIGLIN